MSLAGQLREEIANIDASQRTLFRPESLRARELAWQGRAMLALGLPAACCHAGRWR
jgi:hypothetical protein